MSDQQSDVPSLATLKALLPMIPGFTKAAVDSRSSGRGRKIPVPRRICTICGSKFDEGILHPNQPDLKPDVCPGCKGLLDEGWTCCVADMRYAFLRAEYLKPFAGKVVAVTTEEMNAIDEKFKGSVKAKDETHKDPTPAV